MNVLMVETAREVNITSINLAFNREIIGKIGIITLFSGFNYEVVGPASTKNKREYAEKHGYSFYDESASPALALVEDRHPQWQKIPVVLSRLKEQDWLLW